MKKHINSKDAINSSQALLKLKDTQPEITCPVINKVGRMISQITTMKPYKDDYCLTARLEEIRSELENIRQANRDLRDWGYLLYEATLDLDKENVKLINQLTK